MPEGPAHWHEFWEDDVKPSAYLEKRRYTVDRGVIRPPAGLVPDILDRAAILYLLREWDYDYKGPDL